MKSLYAIVFSLLFTSFCYSQDEENARVQMLKMAITTYNTEHFYRGLAELKKMKYSDFTLDDKRQLEEKLNSDIPHKGEYFKFIGFLKREAFLWDFERENDIPKNLLQDYNLAMVRAGSDIKLDLLMYNVKKYELSDEFSYDLVPVLVYTHRKEVYDYLLDLIMSDEKKCNHPDLETEGKFTCAYVIIETIAPHIIDFPAEIDRTGSLKDPSPALLETVREWIRENKASYEINHEIY